MKTVERAFAQLIPDRAVHYNVCVLWWQQMQKPTKRAYHNEGHVEAVLDCLGAWTEGEPSGALLAAALYHDAVYDPTRKDNETQSAQLCRAEMEAVGHLSAAEINETVRLIELTASHNVEASDSSGILLCDADLFILGDTSENYAVYVQAIRTEYAHVSDADWRLGRPAVMRRFLEREQIYQGTWDGHEARGKTGPRQYRP